MIGEPKKAKELVNAFLSRNEDAIRQTSALFGAYLFRIALNITGNQEDAEECVQDAYLSAWNSIPPEEPENLKAWLSMVVRRKAIDRYR
ncbi:MAG: RNA polymerase sigma factor, partial [Lachnospiraceae bacterium]|nr:RNA polymerase sigma factor [Lachnospiraceae bacterium]